jgi:hypothetical protein
MVPLSRSRNQLRCERLLVLSKGGHAIMLPFAVKSVAVPDEVVQLELASVFG